MENLSNKLLTTAFEASLECSDPESILKRLKGKKWLIVGNHDGSWMDKVDLNHYFVSVDNYLETTDGVHGMTICHYPLLTWKNAGRTYMVHGHIFMRTQIQIIGR